MLSKFNRLLTYKLALLLQAKIKEIHVQILKEVHVLLVSQEV